MPQQLKPHHQTLDTFLLEQLCHTLPAGSNLLQTRVLRKTVGEQVEYQARAETRLPTGETASGQLTATLEGVPESADLWVTWSSPIWAAVGEP